MTVTKRVPSSATPDNTSRVATVGAIIAVPASLVRDLWTRSWGGAWGRTWYSVSAAIAGVEASPAVDATQRVGSVPSANTTKRVTLA